MATLGPHPGGVSRVAFDENARQVSTVSDDALLRVWDVESRETLKLIPYAWLGMIDMSTLRYGLVLLPLVPLGTWTGAHLSRLIREELFRQIILVLVLLTGLKMVL